MANAAALNVVVVANTTQATAALGKLQAQLGATTATANATTSTLGSKFATATKYAASAAGGALVYGLYKGVKAGIDFEKQMDAVGAVANASGREMNKLEKQALKLGQSTTYSANEVAQAQEELVKGGLKVQDILGGGLKAALNLAAAGQLDLATAAETTVNAMKLFDLRGKDAAAVADMLATAANKTTADVEDFAMAMKQGGSVTKQVGYDLNDTVTVLEALAEAGIKNSDAGTSMKTAFLQLIAPTEKQAQLAKQLGLDLLDQNGNLKDAAGLSMELRDALGGMSNAQRAANLKVLAGTDGFRTLSALYDAGPAKLEALSRANAKQGTAQDIARKKMDNTAGSLEQLSGAFETLSIKMFQSAQSPIRGFIDTLTVKLEAFTRIVTSKRLSSDEKISRVIDLISDSVQQAIPKIAEVGAKIGAALIKGILRAFWEGDLLTKLFIGGGLLRMFGGAGVIGAAGKKIGGALATRIGFALLSSAEKGGVIATALLSIAPLAGPAAGYALAAVIIAILGKEIGEWLAKQDFIKDLTNKKTVTRADAISALEGMNSAELRHAVEVYAQLGRISEKAIWKWVESGKISAATGQRLINVMEKVNRATGNALIALGKHADRAGRAVKAFTTSGADWLRALAQGGKEQMEKLGDALKGPLTKALERAGEKVHDFTTDSAKWLRNLAKDADRSGDKFAKSMKKVGDSVTGAASVVTHGLSIIISNTNKALKGFGVKKVSVALAGVGSAASAFGSNGKQRGGTIVPGYGSGDKVPAMLEPGEVVLNREAVRSFGGASRANRLNKMFPRFARGGVVPGDTGGLHSGILHFVSSLYRNYGGMVTSGLRGADTGSLHSTGQAADYVPGDWKGASAAANRAGSSLLEGIYNPGWHGGSPVSWDTGNRVPSSYWAAEWGNHLDHIHLAIADGTKAVAGKVAERIKRVMLKGPDGPIKNIGQAALDKVWRAANAYIAKHAPTGDFVGADAGGAVPVQMGKILLANGFSRAGAAGIIGNAYRESLWNPGAVGTGGGGLFGFTTSPVSLADMQAFAKRRGTSWTNVATQMEFMLTGSGSGGLVSGDYYNGLEGFLKKTNNLHDATYRFMNEWERPGIPAFEDRYAGAQKAFQMSGWQRGGIIGLAGGGDPKKDGKPIHGSVSHGSTDPDFKRLQRVRRIIEQINAIVGERGHAAKIEETISRVEAWASLDSSPGGSDLTPEELARQVELNKRLLELLTKARGMTTHGLRLSNRKPYSKLGDKQFKGPRNTLGQILTDLQGLTGKGGRIGDVRLHLAELGATTTGTAATPMDISTLRSVIEAARYGVFDNQLPRFHSGGVYRSPPGRNEGAAILRDGERVSPPGAGVVVNNSFDFEGLDLIVTTTVNGEIAKRERLSHNRARQYQR